MNIDSTPPAVAEETGATEASPRTPVDSSGKNALASGGPRNLEAGVTNDIKSAIFDSAELATRSASLAAKAGLEMHQAAQELIRTSASQLRMNKILLGAVGGLLLVVLSLFALISFRLQDRVSQLDAMVLAVGKRVISMDAAVELFNSVSDVIKDVSQKQDAISNSQAKLEQRIVDAVKSTQAVPDLKPSPVDDKNKEVLRLVQEVNTKLVHQANAAKLTSAQIQKLQSTIPDAGNFRREMEAIVLQMKERAVPETAASVAAPSVAKQRERLVQFPRTSPSGQSAEKP